MQNVLEIGFGLLYLIGAIFNSLYTMRHSAEFYGSFADQALFGVARKFVRAVVIPRGRLFTGLLIGFQVLVALAILSRGPYVVWGLIAGVVFCLGAMFVMSIKGALANLCIGVMQLILVWLR